MTVCEWQRYQVAVSAIIEHQPQQKLSLQQLRK